MTTSDVPGKGLGLGLKLGYGVADVGASLSYVAINTWLLFYLVNTVGLSPLAAGVVFVLGRAFDAVLDPVVGSWLDRRRGRIRRTRLIAWASVPFGAAFASLWAIPEGSLWLALMALLATSLLYTVVQVPYMSLTPDLAPDYDDRTELTGYRVAFGIVGSLVAAATPPVLVMAVAPAPSLAASGPLGWVVLGVAFGALTAVPYLITAWAVPEPATAGTVAPPATFRVRDAFRIHGFREILAAFLAITVGLMIVSSMLPFFLESALRVAPGGQTVVLGLFFGVAAVVFPAWSFASRRFGKRGTLAAACVALAAATLAIVWGVPAGGLGAPLVAGACVAGMALAGVLLLPWAMLPDVVEFGELAGAGRREGTLYALFTFGQKLAGSAGVFANAIAATVFGYQQGVAEQSAATVAGIEWMVGPVAATLFIVAALLALRVPITRATHADARRALSEPTDTEPRA